MSSLNIKITTKRGRTYQIEPKQYDKLEELITYARDEMSKPCIYHMLSWVSDPNSFKTSKRNLIKLFDRRLRKQYKKLKQEVPNTLVAYSIEFKYTDVDEIHGVHDYPTTEEQLPFLHLHFYIIADCNKCILASHGYSGKNVRQVIVKELYHIFCLHCDCLKRKRSSLSFETVQYCLVWNVSNSKGGGSR